MPTTLKDVALRAGVSIKTVSNVIHGRVYVTDEKRERVEEALKELNYQPNLSARYLRKGRVGVIGLAIPELLNPYFAEVSNTIILAAGRQAYTVLVDTTGGERANERMVINGWRPQLLDGVILSPLALEQEDLQPGLVETPVVLLGERFLDVPHDHVAIDNVAAAYEATCHLLRLGYRRIAAIGLRIDIPDQTETSKLRLRGYLQALQEAGIASDRQLITTTEAFYDRESGYSAIRRLFADDVAVDAIFCFNDLMALGALRALYDMGLRVPEDVAVIGFDDIEEGRYAFPALTTISPDKKLIGETAVDFLLGRIEGTRDVPPERVYIPFRLIERESTMGRAGRGARRDVLKDHA
ncbi:LacI family transcriptional regulator [Ktedonobacter sp. SOSP1-52]|uniref:LacI family DNA-binding transcriptional regulator n=1 Tax=Ktedonobacter sp. SOSP1-52 TaxID=2778366 RepID=UPI0019160D5D|nr:LacI family DNA-binding transcriptional regulator [Ktedonobacter sp. SOSP1-52]GHO64754.1 LacI family transcriptional regulator [Ktedonobacter sp. SOSP1-52]